MLQRMWTSLNRDSLINWRNGFVLVTIAIALIYLALIRWLIPADTSLKPALYFVDQTSEARFARYAAEQTQAESARFADVEALQAAMEKNENSVGVLLEEPADAAQTLPEVRLFFQRHHNQKVRNLLAVSTKAELRGLYGAPAVGGATVTETVLRGWGEEGKVPFNEMWVPILLFTDTAMIGLIFIAVLIFMEKEEGTLSAYLVTPGRIWEYILSKALTLAALALLFTMILVPFTLGGGPDYAYLLLLMLGGSLFGSLLGAVVAIYFDNLNQFLFPALTLMVLLGLPSVAYFAPSFSPFWLRLIPTYPLVFGLREALFPSGSPEIVLTALVTMFALSGLLLLAGNFTFRRQLADM